MFGRKRCTAAPGYASSIFAVGTAPRIETTVSTRSRISAATSPSWAGLWASTTASAASATYAGVSSTSPPTASTSPSALPGTMSVAKTGSPTPRASADAMFPAPMKPSFMGMKLSGADELRLVEEALFDQPGALLGGDLHVARREQEDLVGDSLHATLEGVRQARGEVDQALGQLGVGALEVDDHRDRVLELVRDLLGIVEAFRDHQVDRLVAAGAAVAAHGTKRCGAGAGASAATAAP